MDRRKFIKTAVAAGLGAGWTGCQARPEQLPKRPLGRTGEELSIIGFGGIVVMKKPQERANRSVARAVEEHGINYFDVAPSYGNAEERLGPALEPYRKDVFLACKTTEDTAEGARQELHASLERMRTDYFDLYQLHAIKTIEEMETIFGPGGAMETFVKAREEGKVRFLGFSAHGVEAAMAAMERFDFDTTLFPINLPLWTRGNFGPQVVAKAQEKGMGILVLKAHAHGKWPEGVENTYPPCWYQPITNPEEARLSFRFGLSKGATAVVPPGNEELFWQALELAGQVEPLTAAEEQRLQELTADAQPLFRYPA